MNAHFFDIETVLTSDAKVWIVDKSRPSVCLMRIEQSEFNLSKKGIYRSQGNRISFQGVDYYLPDVVMDDLKIRCKNMKANVSNLAFSMREFLDPETISTRDHRLEMDFISHLRNTQDDVYFICSRNTKKAYAGIINKIEEKLESFGIKVKKYYFISETFYERDEDQTSFDKVRLLLQHLVGLKTEGRKFLSESVERYDQISFYDEDSKTCRLALEVSEMLSVLAQNSAVEAKEDIKSLLVESTPTLFVNMVTANRLAKFSSKRVDLKYGTLIKSFESYRYLG